MKSQYVLTPEGSSLMASRSTSASAAGAEPALDTLAFSEDSLFISEIYWSELFHCPSRGKPEKGAWLGRLWGDSGPRASPCQKLSPKQSSPGSTLRPPGFGHFFHQNENRASPTKRTSSFQRSQLKSMSVASKLPCW